MKTRAFTLIELLGVIVLLGILSIVIIPKVGDSITNTKETAYVSQEEIIKKAANDFIIDNMQLLEGTDVVTIKLGTLKQKGYLPMNIKNPKTRKNFSNESKIRIEKQDERYVITLTLMDLEDASESVDQNSPIIILNGNYIEYVEINGQFSDPGVKAYAPDGSMIDNISSQILLSGRETVLNTSQKDTYEIKYSVTYGGKTYFATRTVIVRDTEAPIITLPKETTIHASELASFDIMAGVTATDNYDSNPSLTTNSSLTNIPGKYVITYKAKDSSNNETIERRVITVTDNFEFAYTRVDYIESTGTQYINTGVMAHYNTGFEIDFMSQNDIDKIRPKFGTILGARQTYHDNGYQLTTYNETTLLGHFLFGTNTTVANIRYSAGIIPGTRQQISFKNRVLTLPDNTTTTVTNNSFSTPTPLTIFALNDAVDGVVENSNTKLYSLKIYNSNKLVRDFVPCYRNSDQVLGLYDTVENKFYTNNGTGNFETNKEFNDKYVRLNYIESTGTQYINSKYYATPNTGIEADFEFTDLTRQQRIFGIHTTDTNYLTYTMYINGSDKFAYGYKDGTGNWITTNITADKNRHVFKINVNPTYYSLDNQTEVKLSGSKTKNTKYAFYILAANSDDLTIANYAKAKLYSFKIYENGVLVRDMIPVKRKSDNVAGLYDTLNDAFYTNSGTGEFVKGE